ncbi:MAG: hypothetical protein AAFR59_11290, partial [Bacteroidota bacterium]
EDTPRPLRRIPPLFGQVSLRYQINKFYLTSEVMAAGAQTRLSGGDIDDHRIPEGGTPGWSIFNMYLGYQFPPFNLSLRAENLTNEAYCYHGSGVDGYGRSYWLTLQFDF